MTLSDDDEDEAAPAAAASSSSSGTGRRTPVQMDELRAQMIREGYPLAGLSRDDMNRVWVSLTEKRRWPQLQALTGMDAAVLAERVRIIRQQFKAANKK
ncbi:MAG: hypothetical protein H0X24_16375 [Ktedonobacterales bacterium]|nr:hypothetical protein [Ktedonobacterales bacterium]